MTTNVWTLGLGVCALLACVVWTRQLASRGERLRTAFGQFGGHRESGPSELHLVRRQYRHQQLAAFWLLFALVLIGALLALGVFVRIYAERGLDWFSAAGTASFGIDIWLGARAWDLYRDASRRLERIVRV